MEIICVGNELLIGKTLNTNAHWLAKQATDLGVKVQRVTVISDDVSEVAKVVREALRRKPSFVITTGGLGPTFDDKTLEGIAKGLNLRLKVDDEALGMVRKKYETLEREGKIRAVELTPARMKMATFPEGTKPLRNPVGTAPGMLAKINQTVLIALPGVPPEMQAIFEDSVVPILRKKSRNISFFEKSIYADNIMESSLAPLIDKVMQDNDCVYIKSHVFVKQRPQTEGNKSHIELHFSTTSEDSTAARHRLDRAVADLSELVRNNGGTVRTPEEVGRKK